jgi:hypothetical protein
MGILLGIWIVLLLSGICSLRCSSRAWHLVFASIAVIPSFLLFVAEIPMTIEKNQSSWRMDLSWWFLVPLILGVIGLWTWWKAQQTSSSEHEDGAPVCSRGSVAPGH